MRKWIKGDKHIDGRRIAFAIGSVQSPYNAAENHYKPGTECHVCGTKHALGSYLDLLLEYADPVGSAFEKISLATFLR